MKKFLTLAFVLVPLFAFAQSSDYVDMGTKTTSSEKTSFFLLAGYNYFSPSGDIETEYQGGTITFGGDFSKHLGITGIVGLANNVNDSSMYDVKLYLTAQGVFNEDGGFRVKPYVGVGGDYKLFSVDGNDADFSGVGFSAIAGVRFVVKSFMADIGVTYDATTVSYDGLYYTSEIDAAGLNIGLKIGFAI